MSFGSEFDGGYTGRYSQFQAVVLFNLRIRILTLQNPLLGLWRWLHFLHVVLKVEPQGTHPKNHTSTCAATRL